MWQKLKQRIGQWRGSLIIAPSIAGLVIVGSNLGFFRILEWAIFDQFVRLRPAESVDQRIVIVTIGESDIKYVKQWPMSDRVMAKLIRNIKAQQPIVIGIDLYRDLPVEPGHQELVEVFKSTPNAIGIEKVAEPSIAPPPALAQLNQVAANDAVQDADGKIRRGLVLLGEKEGLGIKMALMYLKKQGEKQGEKQGIELQTINARKKIYGLGKAVFVPLTGMEGEYFKKETGGYQILLNFRGKLDRFRHISMREVLENKIPPEFMGERIVLIGPIAPSLNDLFQTPYSSTLFAASDLTPGVVLHANLASQVLSAALEGRPMLRASTKILNGLWIVFWSGCGAILGSMWLSIRKQWVTVGILLTGCAIVTISYLTFLSGWWIPVFTPLLAVAGSVITSIGYVLWQNLKLSYEKLEDYAQTLEEKVVERTAQLAQANTEITALNEKLKAENIRMRAELEVTKQLQQMILPKQEELESIEELEIAGFMEPTDEVGGDYYDIIQQNGKVKISIGDVTGHGLESGVVMLMTQAAIRTLQESNQTDPVQFLDILNRTIYHNVQRINPYKNLTLSILDYSNGTISLSGQHEDIIVVRSGGIIERIDTVNLGFPIGLEEEIADFISSQQVQLDSGDVVVLYTDGITEAFNINQKQYGLDKMCEVISRNWERSAQEIKQAVIEDLRQHIGKQKVFDDITLVVIKQK